MHRRLAYPFLEKADTGSGGGDGKTTTDDKGGQKPAEKPAGEGAGGKTPEQLAQEKTDADAAAAAAAGKKPDDAPASKAPDTYALTLPDGITIEAEDLASFTEEARAEGWTNEKAQAKLTALIERTNAYNEKLKAEAMADPDYGGAKWPETERHATAILDRVRPVGSKLGDEFRAYMTKTGALNNRIVLAFLADIGKLTAEDRPGQGGGSGEGAKSLAQQLYGKD
ncbi:MAG TPA: hypothetical protein VK506_05775 [Conexibacter sp.]|nr:hypothetical protein [Conexibacter sp.]